METKKSSERVNVLIFLLIFSFFILPSNEIFISHATVHDLRLDAAVFSAIVGYQYQNVTHDGDLVISGEEAFTVENSEFYMNGTITVKDTATLIIIDSKFTTIPSRFTDGESIVLTDYANLIIKNSTVIFERPGGFACEILVRDHSTANITSSTFRNRGFVVAFNNSLIYANNSVITTSTRVGAYPQSGVGTFGTSTAVIDNSTMDGVFIWDNSTVSIDNSVLGIVRTAWTETDRTTVNVRNSEVDVLEILGGSPTVHFEGSTVSTAHINGGNVWFTEGSLGTMSSLNASIWLIDSSYGSIETRGNATVTVGWRLPLFGFISMPYSWVPIVRLSLVVVTVGIVITVLAILYRKRAKRILREELQIKERPMDNLQRLGYYL